MGEVPEVFDADSSESSPTRRSNRSVWARPDRECDPAMWTVDNSGGGNGGWRIEVLRCTQTLSLPRSHLMKRLLSLLAAAALAGSIIAAAPSADSTQVEVDGDTVTVTGTLAEELPTVVVGTDAADDAVGSGTGVDIAELRVGFPEAGKVDLSIALGDANPGTGHAPSSVQYSVAPTIAGTTLELIANADPVAGGLEYGSQTCTEGPGGQNTCESSPVEGSYADGVITWTVPTSGLPGAQVNMGNAEVNPQLGNPNAATLTFTGGVLDVAGTNVAVPTIPSATLLVDGVEAGVARLGNAGFEVSASGLTAGEHTLALELCDGTECSTVDLDPITVAAAAS